MRWAGGERHLRTHRPWRRVAARIAAVAVMAGVAIGLGWALRTFSPAPHPDGLPSGGPTSFRPSTSARLTVPTQPVTTQPAATSPIAGPSLVSSARWLTRAGIEAVEVVPTVDGRAPSVDADAVWAQLVAKLPGVDTPGMRDQLVCHVHFAPGKTAWFLEPARPAVGYAATVAAGCNPGAVRDAG